MLSKVSILFLPPTLFTINNFMFFFFYILIFLDLFFLLFFVRFWISPLFLLKFFRTVLQLLHFFLSFLFASCINMFLFLVQNKLIYFYVLNPRLLLFIKVFIIDLKIELFLFLWFIIFFNLYDSLLFLNKLRLHVFDFKSFSFRIIFNVVVKIVIALVSKFMDFG